MQKEGSFKSIFIVMAASLAIAFFWNSIPAIKNTVHSVLDPSAGAMLDGNLIWGMIFIIFIIGLFMTLIQKYATDQETLKELKKEQKILQEEMKKYKDDPAKVMELQKKSFEFLPKTMKLSMRAMMYTGVPLILFFRWFMDYFSNPALESFRFFGFLSWFWFYLIGSLIFSSILRKVLKVV